MFNLTHRNSLENTSLAHKPVHGLGEDTEGDDAHENDQDDKCESNDVIDGKLEYDLLLRLIVIGTIDLGGNSSSEVTNDLVVIDAASWPIEC